MRRSSGGIGCHVGAGAGGGAAGCAAAGAGQKEKDKDKDKDKIDAKKLIGKWEPAENKDMVTVEFTDKGKMILSVDGGGKSVMIEGTYKLDGNKLEMVMSFGGKEQKET